MSNSGALSGQELPTERILDPTQEVALGLYWTGEGYKVQRAQASQEFKTVETVDGNVITTAVQKSSYTQERAVQILEVIAADPRPIRTLSRVYDFFPCYKTLWNWRQDFSEFDKAWDLAMTMRSDTLMDDAYDIVERVDPTGKDGSAKVAKARLQVHIRQVHAKKINPDWGGVKRHEHDLKGNSLREIAEMAAIREKQVESIPAESTSGSANVR